MKTLVMFCVVALACCAYGAETKLAVAPRSTMATSQLIKGFESSCPSVSIILDEGAAEYVIEADREKESEWLKHYRITLFDKHGKAVFSTDKHSPGAATKDVCKFLSQSK